VTRVQGHKVIYSNCNNSAEDCSILLKFGTKFYHVQAIHGNVQGQRSKIKVTGSTVITA